MLIDLHVHSTASDGTEEPAEVMRAAAAAGLDVVGLSDHDTTQGWGEASAEAARLGIIFVPGVEVSTRHAGRSVHLLALWPSPDDPTFSAMIARTREERVDRARKMVALLAKDFSLEWDAVASKAKRAETIGRPHIADALVEAGVVPTRDEAFVDLLCRDSPYYVPHYAPEIVEAVGCVRRAGGVPILAHPAADGRGFVVPDDLLESLVGAGLVGLEVDHRDHSPAERERLATLAARLGLVRTGSSDYHGAGKLNRLGENTTTLEAFESLGEARG